MIRPASDRKLALFGLACVVVYYVARLAPLPPWAGDAVFVVPPALAAALHLRRGLGESGRSRLFFGLTSLGAALWAGAALLHTVAGYSGSGAGRFASGPFSGPSETLFLVFLVPLIGGIVLRPHPPPKPRDRVALVDAGLLSIALVFGFIRLSFLPQARLFDRGWSAELLFAAELLLLALWSVSLWRRMDDRSWARVYGCLALFASGYGLFHFVASGAGGAPAPVGIWDLVWIVPFFFLAAAALPGDLAPRRPVQGFLVVLLACPGPVAFDLLVDRILPQVGVPGHTAHTLVLLPVVALLAAGAALRLYLEGRAAAQAVSEFRSRADEEQRARRLATLSSLTEAVMWDLERSLADVVTRARAAADAMGDKGERAVHQAERARMVADQAAAALTLPRRGPRRELSIGPLVEEAVEVAMEEGLPLRVTVEGLGSLAPVFGDPAALRGAFLHLIRNAAQASPGGVLWIGAESTSGEVVLRFHDDGAGVPVEQRHRIFDPFFTTRRVGEGVGLGLTLVHFVARDHGGSVVLEPSRTGACFALRLPLWERHAAFPSRDDWPFAAAVLASLGLASIMALLPTPAARAIASPLVPGAAALVAALSLGLIAIRRRGRERLFWSLLAAGPALWTGIHSLRFLAARALGSPADDAAWPHLVYAAADWAWVAALLVRPDRRELVRPAWLTLLGAGAALCLIAYFYTYLVVLPAPFAAGDRTVLDQLVLSRGLQRLALAVWAGGLALRALSPYWRGLYARLALAFGVWAAGHAVAGYAVSRPGYVAGSPLELGWVIPFVVLAGLGLREALGRGAEGLRATVVTPSLLRPAVALAALAAIPAFDAVIGGSHHPGLDAARDAVTRATVVVVGLILAAREVVAQREMTATRMLLEGTRTQLRDAERRSRLLGVMGSAVHELAGHLSGITSVLRLLLAQGDLPARVRSDAARIQARTEDATRIVRNLTGAARGGPRDLDYAPVNEIVGFVAEQRRADLAHEGISVEVALDPHLPVIPVDTAALQHVLLGLVDNAALAVRRGGSEGGVRLTTRYDEGEIVVSVTDDGPGLPPRTLRSLARGGRSGWSEAGLGLRLASEVAEEHGGLLTGRNLPQGGAELQIRLPVVARSQRNSAG